MASYSVKQISDRLGAPVIGASDLIIAGVEQLDAADSTQISFVRDAKHLSAWANSKAAAAIVTTGLDIDPGPGRAVIVVDDADLALAKVLELFAPPECRPERGVHPMAAVHGTAVLGQDVAIGPFCLIGVGVKVGDGCIIHAGVSIMDGVVIGQGCELFPGVVVRERCELGSTVIVHANSVIGSDGFGYRPAPDGSGLVKIPQIGTVQIGDRVEIGSCVCIDRGKFSATVIGAGTKIDNLCQVAHNSRIGEDCILAGQAGLAGSVTLGDGVLVGGQAGVADQKTIGSGARIGGQAGVVTDVPAGAQWTGYPARDSGEALREAAALRRLPRLLRALRHRLNSAGR